MYLLTLVYWHHVRGFNEHLTILCFFVRYHSKMHYSDFSLASLLDKSKLNRGNHKRVNLSSFTVTHTHSAPTVKGLPLKLSCCPTNLICILY